jgi:hypothetical protein
MKKYFFDLVSPQRTEFDFRGCEFLNPETAFRQAELLALDLSVATESTWSGWAIEVRSTLGRQLLAVPVPVCALSAA